jgi:endoglucanase
MSSTLGVVFGWPDSSGTGFSLTPGLTYTLTFDAWANVAVCIQSKIGESQSPYAAYSLQTDCLTTTKMTYTQGFTATAPNMIPAGIVFLFTEPTTDTVCFANVSVTAS